MVIPQYILFVDNIGQNITNVRDSVSALKERMILNEEIAFYGFHYTKWNMPVPLDIAGMDSAIENFGKHKKHCSVM